MLTTVLTIIENNATAPQFLALVIMVLFLWPLAMIGTQTLTQKVLDTYFKKSK